jgi:hypothetical protein
MPSPLITTYIIRRGQLLPKKWTSRGMAAPANELQERGQYSSRAFVLGWPLFALPPGLQQPGFCLTISVGTPPMDIKASVCGLPESLRGSYDKDKDYLCKWSTIEIFNNLFSLKDALMPYS